MRKAFDRLEFTALFTALSDQGLDRAYIELLKLLYLDQPASVANSSFFAIRRGVKQGDVLSPILFNAGLEHAMRKWKLELTNHGILLTEGRQRLTNTRFADDIMIFAKSLSELVEMLELLVKALLDVGLELNLQKTKILTTFPNDEIVAHGGSVTVSGQHVDVLKADSAHKYLGRKLSAMPSKRAEASFLFAPLLLGQSFTLTSGGCSTNTCLRTCVCGYLTLLLVLACCMDYRFSP